MSIPMPSERERWRCARCGNLTRFDVTRTARSRDYAHVGLSGAPRVEESDVPGETVERVSCRWCDAAGSVEAVARPAAQDAPERQDAPGSSAEQA